MSVPITVVCAACNKGATGTADALPQFGVELAVIAESLGFNYVFDLARGRVVIFCGTRCRDANITKSGYLRARIIQPRKGGEQ